MILRGKFRSKNARKRAQKRFLLQISAGVCGVLLLIFGFVYVAQQHFLRVTTFTFATDGILVDTQLATVAHEALKGNLLGFFPRDSVLFLSTSRLTDSLQDAFPRISDIKITRIGFQHIDIDIQERTPGALWCGDIVPPTQNASLDSGVEKQSSPIYQGTCYLVDVSGFIYSKAPSYTGDPFLRYYSSLEHSGPIGQQMIDTDEFSRWQKLHVLLGEADVHVQALLLVDERDVELYLDNTLRVIVPRKLENTTIHNRLVALLGSDTIDHARTVTYIDMRFGAKVFVKYSDEVTDDSMY